MKIHIVFVLAAVALSVACSKEDLGNTPPPVGKQIAVSFSADYPAFDDATRADLQLGSDTFTGTWAEGVDRVGLSVFDTNAIDPENTDFALTGNKNIPFTRQNGLFTGYITADEVSGASLYYLAYSPYSEDFIPNVLSGFIPFGPDRTQVGGKFNSRYDILISAAITSTPIWTAADDGMLNFDFMRETPIIAFDLKGVTDPISYVTLTADQPIAADMITLSAVMPTPDTTDPTVIYKGTLYDTIELTFVDEAGNPAPVDASTSDIYAFFNVPRSINSGETGTDAGIITYNLTLDAYTTTGKHGTYSIPNVTVGSNNPNMKRSLHAGEKLQESIDAGL